MGKTPIHSKLAERAVVCSHNGTPYGNKKRQTTPVLHSIRESHRCNAKPDSEVCQLYVSIYIKVRNRESECLMF